MKVGSIVRFGAVLAMAFSFGAVAVYAQGAVTIEEGRETFLKGDYARVLQISRLAKPNGGDSAAFGALEIRSLLATGKHQEAFQRGLTLSRQMSFDAELALAAADAFRASGRRAQVEHVLRTAARSRPGLPIKGYSREVVMYGEVLLEMGVDAKRVLDEYYFPAKKADPDGRSAYAAIGRLALANHDRELAAETFRAGLKKFPGDPEFLLGMEQSGVPLPLAQQKKEEEILRYLDLALAANPNSAEALVLKATQHSGRKEFAEAKKVLEQVIEVNPHHPEAWAQLAAIALLNEDQKTAGNALRSARKIWKANPKVPETIGVTLAAHYRFEEGIQYLQQASRLDPQSASIKFELGSNQLRFGQLEEGWKNVEFAHQVDPYNVAAFNLVSLRDKIKDYPVWEREGVLLRMSPEDMAVIGDRVMDLAAESKITLCKKYGIELAQEVMVEMLPRQEDFAIRTFGLPGGESFLGVCFGPLITMTSPRGRLGRANWETVLWHEMAHTITLAATRHRIPRWLSEGLSVYEERQVRPGWGQGMTAEFRERFLSEDMPEILDLDESFACEDISFGYYHSSLVAEFIIDRFGMKAMRALLSDLKSGKTLEESLPKRTLPLKKLEASFRDFAKKEAEAYGPELDWTAMSDEEYVAYRNNPAGWVSDHPKRYASSMMFVSRLLEEKEWAQAKELLEKIIADEPSNRESYNPYWALSLACRALEDEDGERAALSQLLQIDSNATEAAARLLELSTDLPVQDRLVNADRMLETNPFQERAYRTLAQSAMESGDDDRARAACVSLLALEPRDSSRLHYDLATLYHEEDPRRARREVLKALEDNPRFQLALKLLSELPPTSP